MAAYADDVHLPAARPGESLGRYPDGQGRFTPLNAATPNSPNALPRLGAVVISEVHRAPQPASPAALALDPQLQTNDLEFIELYNTTQSAFNLAAWQIRGSIEYEFPSTAIMDAGQTLVVVPFDVDDPANADRAAAFRLEYGLANGVRLWGGYAGQLDDRSGHVVLLRADVPRPDEPTQIPYVLEDELLYDDIAPWPALETGMSLQRNLPPEFGNERALVGFRSAHDRFRGRLGQRRLQS